MNRLFFFSKKFFVVIMIISLALSSSSCRHLAKPVVKKTWKYLLTFAAFVAIEELAAGDLLKRFEDAPEDKDPINITIVNENNQNIELDLTNNGQYWKKEVIPPKKNVSFTSDKKGLVGVKSGEGYFLLREGKCYKACNENGRITIAEMSDEESKKTIDSLGTN